MITDKLIVLILISFYWSMRKADYVRFSEVKKKYTKLIFSMQRLDLDITTLKK